MKAFKDDHGSVFLFRPDQNIARFNKSAERLAIPEFPEALFFEALKTLVDIDRDWVKSGHGHENRTAKLLLIASPQKNPAQIFLRRV